MKKILVAAAVAVFSFNAAFAQYGPRDHRPDHYEYRGGRGNDIDFLQREARQQISEGSRRGLLTPRESRALMSRYDFIRAKEHKFSRHGRLSPKEARILRSDLENLLSDTRRLTRNGDHWARERRHRY